MDRKLEFSTGEFYHIYSRGVDKRVIFQDKSDYFRFVALLLLCNSPAPVHIKSMFPRGLSSGDFGEVVNAANYTKRGKTEKLTAVGGYCLMPNHFHLLLKETDDNGNGIPRFLSKVLTAYSMYFNKKYSRTGSLFGGRFQAVHADSDEYLKYLYAYIHLNPVKLIESGWQEKGIGNTERAKNYLTAYEHSSYRDYLGYERPEKSVLDIAAFPEYFMTRKEFSDFMNDWLNYKNQSA